MTTPTVIPAVYSSVMRRHIRPISCATVGLAHSSKAPFHVVAAAASECGHRVPMTTTSTHLSRRATVSSRAVPTAPPTMSRDHRVASSISTMTRGRYGSRRVRPPAWAVIQRGGASRVVTPPTIGPDPAPVHDDHDPPDDDAPWAYRVYLAVGSNMGNRYDNIRRALLLLETTTTTNMTAATTTNTRLFRTSLLYESAPMYVLDQPAFLNGVVEIGTDLAPLDLLHWIKTVEAQLGRDLGNPVRNGPRPVDLDILLYFRRRPPRTESSPDDVALKSSQDEWGDIWGEPIIHETPSLTIPHPRIPERDFVLRPLVDVAGPDCPHPGLNTTIGDLRQKLWRRTHWPSRPVETEQEPISLEKEIALSGMVQVLPLPRNRLLYWNETLVMGILNVTPDSFSDGGSPWSQSADAAAQQAMLMVQEHGAHVIDVGGESTRPGAPAITLQQELLRIIPVIQRIRQLSDIPISIDTRRADVAQAAVDAGADMVNDVSGGTFDDQMLTTVGQLGVPMILMHMRGTPATMQRMTRYDDVVQEVGHYLRRQSHRAERKGIHRWVQIIDPGIGFAKDLHGNLTLLRSLGRIRDNVGYLPLLIGTSRKGFIGTLAGVTHAADRDPGSLASIVTALSMEHLSPARSQQCTMVRVHNVAATRQAMLVMDAIHRV